MNQDEIMKTLLDSVAFSLTHSRESARLAFDGTLFEMEDSGYQSPLSKSVDFPKKRSYRQRRLSALKKAIKNLDDDLIHDLKIAEKEIINADKQDPQRPILSEQFPTNYFVLSRAIGLVSDRSVGKPGRRDLAPFHAAAGSLLGYYEAVRGPATATMSETKNGKEYSGAIEFLNQEFQRLCSDNVDRREAARTIIEKRKAGKPDT